MCVYTRYGRTLTINVVAFLCGCTHAMVGMLTINVVAFLCGCTHAMVGMLTINVVAFLCGCHTLWSGR